MDMTLCSSKFCPMRESCFRAQARPNPFGQSYSNFEYVCHEQSGFCNFIKIDEGDVLNDKLPRIRGSKTRKLKK